MSRMSGEKKNRWAKESDTSCTQGGCGVAGVAGGGALLAAARGGRAAGGCPGAAV